MAIFTSVVYQNEHLAESSTDVNAIVRVTCAEAGVAGQTGVGDVGEIVIVDTSASMGLVNMQAAKDAAMVAVDTIVDGTFFAIIAGNHRAYLAYPRVTSGPGMVRMTPQTRSDAKQAIAGFRSDGGTAMGSWLLLADSLFSSIPSLAGKHAILLTDGENHNESVQQLDAAIRQCLGKFQVDCRGIGIEWQVSEIRKIATALLGTVDMIPSPKDLPGVFRDLISRSMGRGVPDAHLRVWVPQGATTLFVRQVSPTVEDLTSRGQPIDALTKGYPTGAWGDESRDFHVSVRLEAKAVGTEQLAARVQLATGTAILTQGLVKAKWSSDPSLSTRINEEVAHYTGQTELATAIQEGLAARSQGDDRTATQKLGRAAQLAEQTGNKEASTRLSKVVDITDAATGKVTMKKSISRADEMALDTASTKTTRIKG
ncbi:MAG: VWA domain-containing protein [Propionibacteriaceae bacterium]|nr:VWA domain-containing protein [Propionibacteriaceae bacterium]